MSNIIQLLEKMGAEASLQPAQSAELAIAQSELSDELKDTLRNRDTLSLEHQLDICPDIVCLVAGPEDEPQPEDDEPKPAEPQIRAVVNG